MINTEKLTVGSTVIVVNRTVKAEMTPIAALFGLSEESLVADDLVTEMEIGQIFKVTDLDTNTPDGSTSAIIELEYEGTKRHYRIGRSETYDNRHCFELVE